MEINIEYVFAWLIVWIVAGGFLFYGTPDIHDAILVILQNWGAPKCPS